VNPCTGWRREITSTGWCRTIKYFFLIFNVFKIF
jgi:hypothetical protein